MSSIKKTLMKQGMKLMTDPRVMKMMQDERVMKAVKRLLPENPLMLSSPSHSSSASSNS